jgi:phosphatidylserine/phosphatidylglycerophosphate/cardiolipin synthase-like enzyme
MGTAAVGPMICGVSSGEHTAREETLEATTAFVWDELARYKADKRFLDHYPDDFRTFWAPRDDIHGMLVSLLRSAQRSIVLNMFGYDDEAFDDVIRHKLEDEGVYVQISLDSRQAAGKHEKAILEKWNNGAFGNSIAIGTSSRRAISHLKILIVDGIYTVRGSTNWSLSGETQQDNELTLSRDAVIAAETRAVLDLNHDWMLKQMAAKNLGRPKPREPRPKKKPRTTRPA